MFRLLVDDFGISNGLGARRPYSMMNRRMSIYVGEGADRKSTIRIAKLFWNHLGSVAPVGALQLHPA